MSGHHFVSYSTFDGLDFAVRLCAAMESGSDPVRLWLDKRELQPGREWDEAIVEAIRTCDSLLFVMTYDSVDNASVCKLEWGRALKYKKPVIPLLLHADAEMPFRLGERQYIDFSSAFEPALDKLRQQLRLLASAEGLLQALQDRLADARRDLRRAAGADRPRIGDDIAQLERAIAEQQRVVDDPQGAAQCVAEAIARGLESERRRAPPAAAAVRSLRPRFLNPPPGVAPAYFQDRFVETNLIGDLLKDDARRLIWLVGRGGVGKTVLVCRLLRALEGGQLPDGGGLLEVDGIIYLSGTATRRVNLPNLFADLCRLLTDETAARLEALYRQPEPSTDAKMRALLAKFASGRRVVVLLDNFEDMINPETLDLCDAEMDHALRAMLNAPHHTVTVIATTRIAPRALSLVQPGRQVRLDLDDGLPSPYAETILREMDADGKVGLKAAPDAILEEARRRTRGYPRALEALFAILSADRETTLREVLDSTAELLPGNVVEALAGEAFSRLDSTAQQVMQALAVFGRPVPPAAVDYLLQPYLPGVNGASALKRLVHMHFARKEGERFYLHPVDRAYAANRLPAGSPADWAAPRVPVPYTRFALQHRAAGYFREARTPRETWKRVEDLAPQLAEFDLLCAGEDYEEAARVLLAIDLDFLYLWGHYQVMADGHGCLRGHVSDRELRQPILGNLGIAYASLGRAEEAVSLHEEALTLARTGNDEPGQMLWLFHLGDSYSYLGQTARSIDCHRQALALAERLGDRRAAAMQLCCLGNRYGDLGQATTALEHHERALRLARAEADRWGEAYYLDNVAEILIDLNRLDEAVASASDSIRIAGEIGKPSSFPGGRLALAHYYRGDLSAARAAAEAACTQDEPRNTHNVLGTLGLAALFQKDLPAARHAFARAIAHADSLLQYAPHFFTVQDAKALALCGLALCEYGGKRDQHQRAAVEAYRAARHASRDPGNVARTLRLFDALSATDSAGILSAVRPAAAGESRSQP
jgi:tetratricopeptide (TPR) repeat protein